MDIRTEACQRHFRLTKGAETADLTKSPSDHAKAPYAAPCLRGEMRSRRRSCFSQNRHSALMDMTEVNKVTWNVFRQAQSQSKEKPISQHHHAQFLLLSNFVRSHVPTVETTEYSK